MKLYGNVTCPLMATSWTIKVLQSFLVPFLLTFLFDELFLKIAIVAFGILEYILSSNLTKYGFSIIRSFIWVNIDSKGFSNVFCKIAWDEIENICFEHLKIKKKPTNHRKLRFVAGDFGIVMMLQKEKNNSTFKDYPLKKTICISLNAETKRIILKACPDGLRIKEILSRIQEESILELICKKELEAPKTNVIISEEEWETGEMETGEVETGDGSEETGEGETGDGSVSPK